MDISDDKRSSTMDTQKGEAPAETPLKDTPRTKCLDGLRGLAALLVFFHHITPDMTHGQHEYGFGQDGHWHLTSFPIIRLIWSGGNAAVPIFFIISGYALSIGTLTRLRNKSGKAADERRNLLEAVVRRPIRLYAPAMAITLLQVVLLQIPGLVVIDPGIPPFPKGNFIDEMDFFVSNLGYFNPFGEHESVHFPYNLAMWTLPVELKGSLLIYGLLLILSIGAPFRPGISAQTIWAMILLLGGLALLQVTADWTMACFIWGLMLAVVDVWPVEIYMRDAVSQIWSRRKLLATAPILPVLDPGSLKSVKPPRSVRTTASGLITYTYFIIGLYLISQPGFPDHKYSQNTPGWRKLTSMIPASFDDSRFYRYWTTIGSLLVVHAILRIRSIQNLLDLRIFQFLGRISFSLYLIHLPWTRIFADRFKSLIGGYTNPQLESTIWDKIFVISNDGPPGLSLRYMVLMSVALPSTLLVAWLVTLAIDLPSVRLSKRVTAKLRAR